MYVNDIYIYIYPQIRMFSLGNMMTIHWIWGNTIGIPGLVNKQLANLKMAIEIVSFPIKIGGSFHSFLYVYQRVIELNKPFVPTL